MPTTTEAPDAASAAKQAADQDKRMIATLKRAEMQSSDLSSYTPEQIHRARTASPRQRGKALRAFILNGEANGNGPGRPKSGRSALEAAIKVLEDADRPMKASEVAETVVKNKMAPALRGKTPEATIAAQLYVAAKKPGTRIRKLKAGFVIRGAE